MRWQGLGDCGATARARYQLKKMNDCIHFTYPHFTYHQLTSVMLIHNSIIGNCHFADSIFIDENMSTHKIGWMNFSVFTHPSAAALWCVHTVSSNLSFIDLRFHFVDVGIKELLNNLYTTLFSIHSCYFCHCSCLFPVKLVPLVCQVEERLLVENSTWFQF